MSVALEKTSPAEEVNLIPLLGVLWRAKMWIVLGSFVAAIAAGIYATQFATPMYPARATLALEAQQQQVIGDIDSLFAGGGTDIVAINTQIGVMRSRDLVGRLVDALELMDDPEFNSALREPGLISSLTGGERVQPPEEVQRNRVIDQLIATLQITNQRQSLLFNIQIETTDPAKSALIVNSLAELYIESQIRRKLDEATRAIEFLSRRTTELEDSVEELEQGLAQRMEASDAIDAELLQAQNLQLRDLRGRVEDARMRFAEDSALRESIDTAPDFDTLMALLEASGDTRFASVVQRFSARRLDQEGAQVALESITADLDADIRRTQTQLASLEASAAALSIQITTQSDELIEMQQLDREVEAARLLYQTFLTRLQEASIQQGLETADSIVLSQAVMRAPSSPRTILLVALAAVLGAIASASLRLIHEWRFAGFRTTEEIQRLMGISVLGALPALPVRDRKNVLQFLKEKSNSVFAEAIRNLRTSILMVDPDAEPKVILVTSAIPGEGKTTTALALARFFGSLENRRVLLLEADVRRQTLREYVDEERPSSAQLMDVLLGRTRLEDLDLLDDDLGVEVLMGSGGELNAADLFQSRRFQEFLLRLRDSYDHIIIDSPPVLAVPDARILANHSDLRVFVVRWGSTTRTQVRQGLEMLRSVGSPADGTVLTQVDQKKMKSYGYKGQYGYDGSASGYYGQSSK